MANSTYKKHLFKTLYGLVLLYSVNASVELRSDGGDFPLELRAQNITFTCNAGNFTRTTLQWFIDTTIFASYQYTQGDMYPYLVNVSHPIPGLTVQLENLAIKDSVSTFSNFTLMASLCSLVQFNGKSLSCGFMEQKSNSININISAESILNVTYEALFESEEAQLTQIYAHWTDVLASYMCDEDGTTYNVSLNDDSGKTLSDINLSKINCSTNSICSVPLTLQKSNKLVSENYTVTIVSVNKYNVSGINGLTSSTNIMSRLDVTEYMGCNLSVKCPIYFNNSCWLTIDSNKSIQIPIGDHYDEDLSMVNERSYMYQIINGPVRINYTFSYDADTLRNSYLLGVGVAAYVFGIIILIFGSVLGIYIWFKRKHDDFCYWWSAFGCIIISVAIAVLTLILWIVFAALFKESCVDTTSRNITISAIGLSFLLVLCSTIALGGFILAWQLNKKPYIFKFGMEKLITEKEHGSICTVCNKDTTTRINRTNCETCGKILCKGNCYCDPVYIYFLMDKGYVCKSCKDMYWKENEQFSRGESVGKIASSMGEDVANRCKVCKENFKKDKIRCKSCRKYVCNDKSCHGKSIQMENKTEVVCNICYILCKRKEHTDHAIRHPQNTK